MKNLNLKIACLALSLMGTSLALADEAATPSSSSPGLRLGVEAGMNFANFDGQSVGDVFASRLGFVGGGFLDLPLGSVLNLQPELLYEQKGGKFNGNPYQLNYVAIPVLLDINVIGPLGILVGPSFNANVTNSGINNVNSTDIGLVLGGQLNLDRFLIGARYEVGLSNVSSNYAIQNGTFSLLAGLSLL